jgi:plastocyanin
VTLAALIVLGTAAPAAADAGVSMGDNFYDPATVTVTVGETVTWSHVGQAPHTVTADNGSFDSSPNCPTLLTDCMENGDSYSQTFNSAGSFDYFCKVHGQSMSGTVVVEAGGTSPPPGDGGGDEGGGGDGGALPSTGPGPFGQLLVPLGVLLLAMAGLMLWLSARRKRT